MIALGQTLPKQAFRTMSGLPPGSDRTADIRDRKLLPSDKRNGPRAGLRPFSLGGYLLTIRLAVVIGAKHHTFGKALLLLVVETCV